MYLHVGNQKNIRRKDIIGIFDMDNATISSLTRKYLNEEQRKKAIMLMIMESFLGLDKMVKL
jgi:hypothetical protein